MMQNGVGSGVRRTVERDAGSRPVMLMLKRPAIDVKAECKAFPLTLGKTAAWAGLIRSETAKRIGRCRGEIANIRRFPKDGEN
jgi:hypothetical protein